MRKGKKNFLFKYKFPLSFRFIYHAIVKFNKVYSLQEGFWYRSFPMGLGVGITSFYLACTGKLKVIQMEISLQISQSVNGMYQKRTNNPNF